LLEGDVGEGGLTTRRRWTQSCRQMMRDAALFLNVYQIWKKVLNTNNFVGYIARLGIKSQRQYAQHPAHASIGSFGGRQVFNGSTFSSHTSGPRGVLDNPAKIFFSARKSTLLTPLIFSF